MKPINDAAFLQSEKNLRTAEVEVFRVLNQMTFELDGKPTSGTLIIAYEVGDKPMQVQLLRKLSVALNDLADEYESYPNKCLKKPQNVYENPAVAAIQFALETDDGLNFLRLWNEGEFDVLRKEWSDAPEDVYIGADPLYKVTSDSEYISGMDEGVYLMPEPLIIR